MVSLYYSALAYSFNSLLAQDGIDFDALQDAATPNFEGDLSISGLITKAIPYIFTAAGILLLIYLVTGGFGLMVSRGNPKAVEAAKGRISYALLGFLIIFVSFWIVQIVGLLLGIDVIGQIFAS